jgi:hypothetical protein
MNLFKAIALTIFICGSSTVGAMTMDRLENQKNFRFLKVSNNSDYTVIIYYKTNYDANMDMLKRDSAKVCPGHTCEIFIRMASGAKYKIVRESGKSKSRSIAPSLTSGSAIRFANNPKKPAMSSTKSARKGTAK